MIPREDQEDVMCDSASCPEGRTAAAVMVTSMAVLTTSMTCNVAQCCLGTICLDIIHFTHTHTHTATCLPICTKCIPENDTDTGNTLKKKKKEKCTQTVAH